MFSWLGSNPPSEQFMADQIVITEKTSQAKDIRAAVGSRYGDILPAEGHLFDLLEPEDVVPAWKRWSPILLRPEGLYGTRPVEGGNKAAKLRAIREALLSALICALSAVVVAVDPYGRGSGRLSRIEWLSMS